jgi:hypothetical protein
MFKPAGFYFYKTQDGGETVASTASHALLHWYMRTIPDLPGLPDPMPILEVVQTSAPHPGPYDPKFLMVVIGAIERTYGTAPEIASEFYEARWYNNLPNGLSNHKTVVQARRNGEPTVVAYEEVCLGILKCLEANGDVVGLEEP